MLLESSKIDINDIDNLEFPEETNNNHYVDNVKLTSLLTNWKISYNEALKVR